MTQEQKKAAIAKFLVTKGIINPADIDAEITKMAATCPSAVAEKEGLTTEVDLAYKAMEISSGAGAANPTETTPTVTQPTNIVSTEEKLNIAKTLVNQQADRSAVSANSSIESLILDRPAPKDYIKAGTMGIISKEVMDKVVSTYEKSLLPDDAEGVENGIPSTTNFNKLKEAAEKGTPVEVYIGAMSKKAIGYIINKGTSVGSSNTPTKMTREQAETFLVLDTAGYILSSETKPGLKLKYIKSKPDPTTPGKVIPAKCVLADANKNAAIDSGSYVVSKEVSSEIKPASCKTALCFKVDTGKKKKNGNGNVIRTIRVTCKADLPVLVRKVDFVDIFKDASSNTNLDSIPEGKLAQNISEAQQLAIANLRAKASDAATVASVANIASKLSAFDTKPAAPSSNVVV